MQSVNQEESFDPCIGSIGFDEKADPENVQDLLSLKEKSDSCYLRNSRPSF